LAAILIDAGGKAKFSGPYTMTRRIEILVETRRRLVVRRVSEGQRSWCDLCLAEVQMITPDEAAALMNVSSRSIYQSIEAGSLHFTDEPGGLRICEQSLPADNSESDRKLLKWS